MLGFMLSLEFSLSLMDMVKVSVLCKAILILFKGYVFV